MQVMDIESQMEGIVPELEQLSGEKFDIDGFKEAVHFSRQTSELLMLCLESASAVPVPWSFFDATIRMGPAVVLLLNTTNCFSQRFRKV